MLIPASADRKISFNITSDIAPTLSGAKGETGAGESPAEGSAEEPLPRQVGGHDILGVLGVGGMGTVYLATVERRVPGLVAGERVAVKVVHPHLFRTPGFFKRFLREADLGLRSPKDSEPRLDELSQVVADSQHGLAHRENVRVRTHQRIGVLRRRLAPRRRHARYCAC